MAWYGMVCMIWYGMYSISEKFSATAIGKYWKKITGNCHIMYGMVWYV